MANKKNAFTFFCLYIAQTIPTSFFSTVIPVIMRQENFTLTEIGMLQLIKFPWVFKFLWSPIVDRYSTSINDYKRWIFSSELIYAVIVFSVAFLDLKTSTHMVLALIALSFIASATQDIATDALAALTFSKKNKVVVNSMQSMGRFGGTLIGSGLLLILFRKVGGWDSLLPFLALFVIIALLPLFFNKKLVIQQEKSENVKRADWTDIFSFFDRKSILKQIGFLLLYYTPIIGSLAMLRPYLVDLGYDMKQIGIMSGVVGTAAGMLASFLAGFIVRKIGRYYSRILFAVFILVTPIYFYMISLNAVPDIQSLYFGIIMLWGSYGMASVVVNTTAMDCVRTGREGTDFTIQTVLTHTSGIGIVILSGKIADKLGYSNLFLFAFCLAALSLIYILTVFKREQYAKPI